MKHISEYHDCQFDINEVIKKQVEREAWIDWARHPDSTLPSFTPREKVTWSDATKRAVKRGVSIIMA